MLVRRRGFEDLASLVFAAALAVGCSGGDAGRDNVLLDRGSCEVLIECAASLAPDVRDEYEQTYGANGTCWQNGPNRWAACRDFCEMTLETNFIECIAVALPETDTEHLAPGGSCWCGTQAEADGCTTFVWD